MKDLLTGCPLEVFLLTNFSYKKGFFEYVSAANYFGEIVEWIGFYILTLSWGSFSFAVWTYANLAPRLFSTCVPINQVERFSTTNGVRKHLKTIQKEEKQ